VGDQNLARHGGVGSESGHPIGLIVADIIACSSRS